MGLYFRLYGEDGSSNQIVFQCVIPHEEKMKKIQKLCLLLLCSLCISFSAFALRAGNTAPNFSLKNQDDKLISLKKNTNNRWTVIYFFSKTDDDDSLAQATAFRDEVKSLEENGVTVYGVSLDDVATLKDFYDNQNLNFDLLSDNKLRMAMAYGTKVPGAKALKRVTLIIDDKLVVRSIDNDVTPATNAKTVSAKIQELKFNKIDGKDIDGYKIEKNEVEKSEGNGREYEKRKYEKHEFKKFKLEIPETKDSIPDAPQETQESVPDAPKAE